MRRARARYNARKRAERPVKVLIAKVRMPAGGGFFHQHKTMLCRACWRVRLRVDFPASGGVCFDCVSHRRCTDCGETRPVERFVRKNRGWRSTCKDCMVVRQRERKQIRRREIYEREGGVCHICRLPVGEDFEVEHLFPRAAGGTNDPSNLAVAHPLCNQRKGASVRPVQLRLAS